MSMFHLFHYITSPVRVDFLSSNSLSSYSVILVLSKDFMIMKNAKRKLLVLLSSYPPKKISVLKCMSNFTNGIRDSIALVYK